MSVEAEPEPTPVVIPERRGFAIAHQVVELEIDFSEHVRGKTELTIYPDSQELKIIKLNARQCKIEQITVNNLKPALVKYQDPCDQLTIHGQATVHQHHILAAKVESLPPGSLKSELHITLPENLKIEEVNLTEVHTQSAGTIKISKPDVGPVDISQSTQAIADASVAKYTPLTISIEFVSTHLRDALHFVTGKPGNGRWPHVYTRGKLGPGAASCIFPCVDDLNARCTWDLTIRCPRTVRDALKQCLPIENLQALTLNETTDSNAKSTNDDRPMAVLCSGDVTDEILDKNDSTKRTASFSCSQQLSAQQIGIAIGPFDRVNLSELRDAQDDEDLGQNAVEMLGFCLPGRSSEVKNTCLPTTQAIDYIVRKYFACPVRTYSMCFVEDAASQTAVFAGLTICSTKLLYPAEVLDPAQEVTRSLVQAIASQWVGINIVAEDPRDTWTILGVSHFIAENFMKELCGNNEYRFRMKKQSDIICELDRERPSMYDMGAILHVDPSEYEFISIKAPLVLFILDRRIAKVVGISKMPGIIGKILTRARIGDLPNNFLSTDTFQKTCERFYHAKIDDFINQWVKGAGCPRFQVLQRFNKKKLVVEMVINQVQGNNVVERDLEVKTFMRDMREDFRLVYAAPPQPVFTGSMTIRIHEADGTPYEHIVELKESKTSFDIPYNTKYKRLKRSKKQKSKANVPEVVEGENDSLVYCLGDVLQSEEDVASWRLTDWSPEDEERMSAESYEWIRIDADFEWICRIQLQMPGYMSVSQLQQDRDVVAQYESIHHINNYPASSLISSILLRTLMDRRYFHGIRGLAARSLVKHAKNDGDVNNIGLFHLKKAFEELYSVIEHGSQMTRPNDFSDLLSYYLECDIIEAVSLVRDDKGFASKEVKEFLLDKLKFNDNGSNDFSDAYYVSRLMKALTTAVVAKSTRRVDANLMEIDAIDEQYALGRLEQECVGEIDRYRRMDEWTSSYQNLYTRTALECQLMLSKAKISRYGPLHYLQYTRPGNFDMLRVTAYEVLVKNDLFDNTSVLRYILHCMVADLSPWVRSKLSTFFGDALAAKALSEANQEQEQADDGLIIEDSVNEDKRQRDLARRRTIDGATEAIRSEWGQYEELKLFLWNAICHPEIGLTDLQPLLDYCRLLYEPNDELIVVLKYPRYWRVQNLGKGKLKFRQSKKIRTRIVPKWQPPVSTAPKTETAKPRSAITLTLKTANQSPLLTPTPPTPPAPIAAQPLPPANKVVKLKFRPIKRDGL